MSPALEPVTALVQADMAVAPFLSQTVPDEIEILPEDAGLPPLPVYYINLHMSPAGSNEVVEELGRQIRNGFASRYQNAA